MKISLALVLASFSVLTVAKAGFVLEHQHRQYHHHHNSASQNPSASGSTPKSVTTPTSSPNVYYNQGTTAHSVTPSNSAPYARLATPPAATGTSSGGWVQLASGNASFTTYDGCKWTCACGQIVNGYSAAVNQLAYGSEDGAGGACGRCFKITPTSDPFSPSLPGPFGNTIVVKANDLCPADPQDNDWCGQSVSNPLNHHGMQMHFDLCSDFGATAAFFPGSIGSAMLGIYEEVSCSEWSGSDGETLWDGSCLEGEDAPIWPTPGGCPNTGTPPL